MYSNVVLKLFNEPKNAGRISKPDGIATNCNKDGTSYVEFSLRIENNMIMLAQFRAQANPLIIAVCSTITQMLKGQEVDMIVLNADTILRELETENENIDFCLECVKLAVLDYEEKMGKSSKTSKKSSQDEIETELKEDIQEKLINKTNGLNSIDVNTSDDDDDFADFFDDIFDE